MRPFVGRVWAPRQVGVLFSQTNRVTTGGGLGRAPGWLRRVGSVGGFGLLSERKKLLGKVSFSQFPLANKSHLFLISHVLF